MAVSKGDRNFGTFIDRFTIPSLELPDKNCKGLDLGIQPWTLLILYQPSEAAVHWSEFTSNVVFENASTGESAFSGHDDFNSRGFYPRIADAQYASRHSVLTKAIAQGKYVQCACHIPVPTQLPLLYLH